MRHSKSFLSLLLTLAITSRLTAALSVGELRCESLNNPEGIDTLRPRLSWQIQSSERGIMQSAYQIRVATSEARLKSNAADLWDSGKVGAGQSIDLSYQGKPLASHDECFWDVRVWDQNGNASGASKPAKWTMGILRSTDWAGAKWIGLDGSDQTNWLTGTSWIWSPLSSSGTNYFRRVVTIPSNRVIKRARFQYTGNSEARGWIDEFDLGARNNYRTVKFNDITTRLTPGKTYVFGLTGIDKGGTGKPAGVVGLLEIEFMEGEPLLIATDENWKVSDEESAGWNKSDFNDSTWVPSKRIGPAGMEPWGEIRTAEERTLPARWLRKEFAVEKKLKRATVSYSGLGLSELYLNGAKVGNEVLSPALAQYEKRVFYVTHDVTKQLRRGANAIGVVLGGGRYYADRSKVYAGTVTFGWSKLLLKLHFEFTDGSFSDLVSDPSWQLTTNGPIRANSEFDGEEYDARLEFPGWSNPGFNRSKSTAWQQAEIVSAPSDNTVAHLAEPIRVTETLRPIAITEPKPGIFIFDLGQNMVGWCRLKVSGKPGTEVRLRHAETLQSDGTLYMANLRGARVTDTYTLRGSGGKEIYEPRFTYHGFRFVEVTGFPGRPTLDSIEGLVVNDDLPVAGEFSCSNELLNRIHRNIVWGTRGNYRSIPTDCPQRDERQGWLGDRSEECRGESYLFDMSKLYAKWLQDICDAQRESGSLPDVAPATWPIYSDNVTWPSTLIIAPGVLHQQFGNASAIAASYESAKKWLDYMNRFLTNGIIAKDSYGDWCVPPENLQLIHSKDPARQTDKALLATAYFYYDLKLMERYAKLLDKAADAAHFAGWADEIKTAFNGNFLNRERGIYDNGSQTSCVLPLAFGLVPDPIAARVFDHLVDKIVNETHGHIGTGLIGGQYLMRVLTEHGRADLAYTIATQRDYPGWGYMLSQGATTIWELWNGNTADPTMNSGNHVMLVGDLVIWFYEHLAGIKTDPARPGFKHIIMRPTLVGDLKFAKATHRSPYGLISSEWHLNGNKFDWQIIVPPNTTATIVVPAHDSESITEGGKPVTASRSVVFIGTENGRTLFKVGSGKYHFVSR